MKKFIKIGLVVLISISATMFNSCKKAEKGEKGDKGDVGNANVQNYSITISSWQWTYDTYYKRWYYRYYININSQSAILGYVVSGSGYQTIPYYQANPTTFQFDMATNLFMSPPYIEIQYTNFSSFTTAPSYDEFIKIVAIPPAMITNNTDVDFKNYNEVKTRFNLKD